MPSVGPIETILTFTYGIVVFIAVVLVFYAVLVFAARVLHRFTMATRTRQDPALDALHTRYASGEIDEIEFQHLRSVLQAR